MVPLTSSPRRVRGWAGVACRCAIAALAIAAGAAQGRAQASPYVPLDDVAYGYIDALMARGELRALSPIERPYTVRQLQSALDAGDARDTGRGRMSRAWAEALRRSIAKYETSTRGEDATPPGGSPADAAVAPAAVVVVPHGHVAYVYVDALMPRGGLATLASVARPYTTAQLRRAIAADSAGQAYASDTAAAQWRRQIIESVGSIEAGAASAVGGVPDEPAGTPLVPIAAAFSTSIFGTAESSGRRDLARSNGVGGVYPGLAARAVVTAGPVAAAVRGLFDRRLRTDPEYPGRTNRGLVGRFEDTYLSLQAPLGELFVGRQGRNWGPGAAGGLLVGSYAYSYDHLYLRLGRSALAVSALLTRLDDFRPRADSVYQRYLAAHRVALRWRALDVAIEEALIYGGPGRSAEPAYLNPLNIYTASLFNGEAGEGNALVAVDAVLRPRRWGMYAFQLMVDDFQIDACGAGCEEPASYGLTLSAEGVPGPAEHRLFAYYTRVAHLAYRTPTPWEVYQIRGVGIGRPFSDYDELRAGVDIAVFARVPLRAFAAYLRQGEGDYRLPYPATADYPSTPEFLGGRVTRIRRVALSGGGRAGRVEMTGEGGYNVVRGGAPGAARSGFEGRLRLSLESGRLRVLQ